MFRYVAVILLLHSYNCGLGNPIDPTALDELSILGKSLVELAKHCENSFLSSQITNKIKECNLKVPPYGEKEFDCLTFYDINSQLCSIKSDEITKHEHDFNAKVMGKMNVSILCKSGIYWNVSNLKEFPKYEKRAQKVFSNFFLCSKICIESDDVTSDYSNFYCKYFNWGSNILAQIHKSVLEVIPPQDNIMRPDIEVKDNTELLKKVNQTSTVKSEQINEEITTGAKATNAGPILVGHMSQPAHPLTSVSKPSDGTQDDIQKSAHGNVHSVNVLPESMSAPSEPELKPADVEQQPILPEKTSNPSSVQPTDRKEPVLDNPKLKSQSNDQDILYPGNDLDSDEGKDPSDLHSPDDAEDLGEFDEKNNQKQPDNFIMINETPSLSVNGETNQREIFRNTLQDGFPDEEEDHFLSFFLTAVILVVLLYILYHNKSKVSKMVLGLIVEGRQPGRRRTSRGHAYRRLDTLEQAMSSNTSSAPPSKIIY